LFKWVAQTEDVAADKKDDEASKKAGGQVVSYEESSGCGIYFATQVINNACATIATVNAVSFSWEVETEWLVRRGANSWILCAIKGHEHSCTGGCE
jgi:hypothetical protein